MSRSHRRPAHRITAIAATLVLADCFNVPARFKRVYKIDLSQPDADGFVRKIGFVDLLDIKDPESKARTGSASGVFTFPS
jgi:hypothetical protein